MFGFKLPFFLFLYFCSFFFLFFSLFNFNFFHFLDQTNMYSKSNFAEKENEGRAVRETSVEASVSAAPFFPSIFLAAPATVIGMARRQVALE